jgi:hypothetical protein
MVVPETANAIERIVDVFPWLLLGATVLGLLALRFQIPYASMLVLGGVAVAGVLWPVRLSTSWRVGNKAAW